MSSEPQADGILPLGWVRSGLPWLIVGICGSAGMAADLPPAPLGRVITLVREVASGDALAVVDRHRVRAVRFEVVGREPVTDTRAPFRFDFESLGPNSVVVAVALDADGAELGRAELRAVPRDRDAGLRVWLELAGTSAEVTVAGFPDGVERVEIEVDGVLRDELRGPPFVATVVDGGPDTVVVARAFGPGGELAEDAAVLNAELGERTEVRLVETVVLVADRRIHSKPLEPKDLLIRAGSVAVPATIVEAVERPPLAVALVLDLSVSMNWSDPVLGAGTAAMLEAILRPGDALSLVVFRDEAAVLVPLGTDWVHAFELLPRLRSGGRTSVVWDAVLLGLGQVVEAPLGAVLLVTDGRASASRASMPEVHDALEAAGVPFVMALPDYDMVLRSRRRQLLRPLEDFVRTLRGLLVYPGAAESWSEVGEVIGGAFGATVRISGYVPADASGPVVAELAKSTRDLELFQVTNALRAPGETTCGRGGPC